MEADNQLEDLMQRKHVGYAFEIALNSWVTSLSFS